MNEKKHNIITKEFDSYDLYYYTSGKNKKEKTNSCAAKIYCYSKGLKPGIKYSESLPGITSPVFLIKFFKESSEIPQNEVIFYKDTVNSGNYTKELTDKFGEIRKIKLNFSISRFNDIISILRNKKKPLYLFIDEYSLKGGISNTKEIIKEKVCL